MRIVRRTLIAFVAVWLLGATATAETPGLVPPARSAVTCEVVDDPETLALGVVMQLITRCQDELGLSETQRARLDALSLGFLEETFRLEADREVAEDVLAGLLRPDPEDPGRPVNLAAAEATIQERERIVSAQEIAALRAVEASKAVLTPAQRATLASLLAGVLRPRMPALGERT
jgi:hypothetical protein